MANVRPDWFCICGTRHDDCNLHRTMIGREYAWGFVTDEQLRAEVDHRGMLKVGEVPYGSPLCLSRENDKLRKLVETVRSAHSSLQRDRDYLAKQVERCTKDHVIGGHRGLAAASDAQLRAECEQRGFDAIPHGVRLNAESKLLREIETALGREAGRTGVSEGVVDVAERLISERDEWKRRAEAAEAESARRETVVDAKNEMLAELRTKLKDAEASNVAAIREGKIRLLPPRLREVRPHTMGEVWQQFALGEISVADAAKAAGQTAERFVAWFEKEFGLCPDPWFLDVVAKVEKGSGIERLDLPAPKRGDTIDLATLADLLADDVD